MLNKKISRNRKRPPANNQNGFTVVEVIISMIVFLIVTGAAYGVLIVAKNGRTTVSQKTQLNKNVRLALNLVGRDTYNAGFDYPLKYSVNLPDNRISTLLGTPADAGTLADPIPPVIAANDINVNTLAVPNVNTDQVTFLFKDSTFNLTGNVGPPDNQFSKSLSISSFAPAGAINQAVITAASGTNASCAINDLYVISGGNGSALAVLTAKVGTDTVQFAAGDILGFNQDGNTAPISLLNAPAAMQRVTMISYFVTTDGILTRREYANDPSLTTAQRWTDSPLVYGVENFQVRYILDNGTISDNPDTGNSLNLLNLVRQIQFTVTARTTELNQAGQPFRVTMTSTFSTRNMGYDVN